MSPIRILVTVVISVIYLYQVTCFNCTCSNQKWCEPLKTPLPSKEIFIFMLSSDNWRMYDWNKITTIAAFGTVEPEMMCFAHSKGVRVVTKGNFPVANLTNQTERHKWVKDQVHLVMENKYDGINIDFESAIPKESSTVRDGFTLLMSELYASLKAKNLNYQVTIDIAWRPNQDQRFYNYTALVNKYSDFAFVMSYDERSQIYGPCAAWANSALNNTIHGVGQFLREGIPASKLVLGVPWYGYNYPCKRLVGKTCFIKEVPFRGAPCSDAAGSQVNYGNILNDFKPLAIGGILFDDIAKSPYFNFKDEKTGKIHQMWFDDPQSLRYKYQYAVNIGMHGVGMWNVDALDYSNSTEAKKERETMWGAMPVY